MSHVVLDISMSLDGFVTAPNDERGRRLGDDGEVLHHWVVGGPWTYSGEPTGEPTGVDKEALDEALQAGAAVVVVARMTSPMAGAAARPAACLASW